MHLTNQLVAKAVTFLTYEHKQNNLHVHKVNIAIYPYFNCGGQGVNIDPAQPFTIYNI
jgi:hypothetical protein